MQHEGTRDADGLLRRVALRVVALQVHLVDFVEERAVRGDLVRVDAARCVRSARKVPTLEVRRREGFICGYTDLHRQDALRFSGQQGRADGARDGEVRADRQVVARVRAERRHDGGVVGHAALQHDATAHRLVVHHLVQVVAHHRQAQARGHLGFRSAFRQRGVDGRFHEYRAAFAQINGSFCRKRQRTVIGQRNAQARGLFFDEAASARRAHLVHLEVGHLPRRQPDVLRVLAADLEHGVHQRIGRRSGAGLRGDLVAHGIGPDKVADHGAPAARDARGHHVRPATHALGKRGQAIAHRLLGVAARTQVLRVKQHAVSADEHQVRAGRAHVHAERHRHRLTRGQRVHDCRARHRAAVVGGRTSRVPRAGGQREPAVRRAIHVR